MKSKIIKLRILVLIILLIETLITAIFVGLAAYKWEWLINVNFGVGYVLFSSHLFIYWVRRQIIIKKFKKSIEQNLLFAAYIEKRSYVHNKLVFYTSFFVIAISLLLNVIFIFLSNDSDLPLDILSFLSAVLVLTSPFLGKFYQKILFISQTEGDMKRDAIKIDIKYCVFNSLTLNDAIEDLKTSGETKKVVQEDDAIDSNKIAQRLDNRIENLHDEISLFENYLMFESISKTLNKNDGKEFKRQLLNANSMKDIFAIIKSNKA